MSLSTQGSDDGENSLKRRRKGLGMLDDDDDDDGTPLALGGPIKVSAASEASGGASLVRRALGPRRSCDEMCRSIMGLCDRCEQKFEASRKDEDDEDDEDDEPADQGGAAGAAAEAPLNRGNRLEIVDPDGPESFERLPCVCCIILWRPLSFLCRSVLSWGGCCLLLTQ